jgi:RND family efflux transporter MFP subunit
MQGIVAFLALSLVAGVTAGCSRSHAETRAPAELPVVAVAPVTRGDIARVLTVAGEFRPYQEIDVHAKVAGYVKSITVDVGDRVQTGQLLAVLEIPELQNELQQDEASVKRAAEEVTRADADVTRAESVHQAAHLASERLASVNKVRPKLVAEQDLDEASGRDRVAEAQVATSNAAAGSAREQLEIAKATLARTTTMIAYARITAPFAGVITHRFADTGAMIQAGTSSQTQTMPLVRLSQNDRLRLVIPVPESAVARIHTGQPVDVRVASLAKTWPGTVARLAERLDTETRTMRVEVDVTNQTLALVPGMYAQVAIALDRAHDVLTVPVQAIDRTGAHARVLAVAHDGTVDERDVTTGLEASDRVEIANGLSAGDLVVVGNRAQLKPKMVVSPKVVATATTAAGDR